MSCWHSAASVAIPLRSPPYLLTPASALIRLSEASRIFELSTNCVRRSTSQWSEHLGSHTGVSSTL
eukprot:15483335-Alexandrium_andersonii.AAC.1